MSAVNPKEPERAVARVLQFASATWRAWRVRIVDVRSGIGTPAPGDRGRLGLVGAWLALAVLGSLALVAYAAAPGRAGATPPRWPAASALARDEERPTLVMLAHPLCPCSRASVAELARIMARVRGGMRAHLVLLRPEHADEGTPDEALATAAAAIPGVTVHDDPGGEETRRFGGLTSGQTLLYDVSGRLRFAGGITASRGHQGDSYGADALVAAVRSGTGDAVAATAPVFGCSLGTAPVRPDADRETRS